jgi:hypothetical protein
MPRGPVVAGMTVSMSRHICASTQVHSESFVFSRTRAESAMPMASAWMSGRPCMICGKYTGLS